MSGDSWQKGPLGGTLEHHRERHAEGTGWERGMSNWDAVRKEMRVEDSTFPSTLSISQLNSLHLLLEWWEGEWQDRSIMIRTEEVLERHANSDERDERIPQALDLGISAYHERLFNLLLYEFYFYGQSTAAPIQLRRHQASLIAACQRLANSVLMLRDLSTSTPAIIHNHTTDKVLDAEDVSQPKGAIIEACPWLPEDSKRGLPYFLWDINEQKTVRVDELENRPAYTVVSHTWGRWRIQDEGANIPGVSWKVPRNTKFNVENLPNFMKTRQSEFLPTTYLWFDLLCIPQDGSELADIEIARQAAIFGGATRATIWLNDIDDWSGIQLGLQWLALQYLQVSAPTLYDVEATLKELQESPDFSTELFESFEHASSTTGTGQKPSGWFTSLWTLQESFLRPEMIFCNRQWEILRICNHPKAPAVTLDSILALVDFEKRNASIENMEDTIPTANEITALIHHTRFDSLLEYSPLTALNMASRRQCSEGRAEGIMSVLGATSWFKQTSRSERESNLVFAQYPIDFLREIRNVLGTNFFTSYYGNCCFWDIFKLNETGEVDVIVAGTLLPFDNLRDGSKVITQMSAANVIDHPSTFTWQLDDEGIVVMPEAAVVASTEEDDGSSSGNSIVATITGPSAEDQTQMDIAPQTDMKQWMQSCFSGVPKFALCLQYNLKGWSRGVILMRVFDDEDPPKTLAKIGDYYTEATGDYVEPLSRKVDWEVL
ncbi:uncharacterized protein KY384_008093 [Bacidia gigantensis]|uniref:uncharacterized protein n=1 Tax=Bacidia gigantensis TaxID=2732470 RepID=UPI001D052953|nr:uncharacterized protein KY384_008093 [Bacidia gigantensis]KAG8526664.1 hypothetical protein KY384_008093 [Bacidia gigantensis]